MNHKVKIQFVGPKGKDITEDHIVNADRGKDAEALLMEKLKPRVNRFIALSTTIAGYTDIPFYKGSDFLIGKADRFHEVTVDLTDHKAIYLIPAHSHAEAVERALDISGMTDEEIVGYKRSSIISVYDPLNELWIGDFHNRMQLRKQANFYTPVVERGPGKQMDLEEVIEAAKKEAPDNVDPETGEEFSREVVRFTGNVTTVEGEDMQNGQDPTAQEESYFVATPQLGPGTTEEKSKPTSKAKKESKPKKAKPSAEEGKVEKRKANRRNNWVSPTK